MIPAKRRCRGIDVEELYDTAVPPMQCAGNRAAADKAKAIRDAPLTRLTPVRVAWLGTFQ